MTTQTESMKVKIKTPETEPLYYVLSNGRVAFPPSSFAMGDIYRKTREELRRAIPQWQQYALKLYESGDTQDPTYLRAIQALPNSVEQAIKRGIQREKDSTKLWDEDVRTAINNGHLENRRLTAEVASRRPPGPKVLEYIDVIIDSPHYNEKTAVDYRFVNCRSDEFHWSLAKGTNLICPHVALAIIQYSVEYPGTFHGKIQIVSPRGRPFVPFTLSTVEELDVLVRRYGLKQTYYEINKRVLSNKLNFDPSLLRVMQNTNFITFEAVPQRFKPKEVEPQSEEEAMFSVVNEMEEDIIKTFQRAGYVIKGNRVVEFKDTQDETLSRHFESVDGKRALRLLYNRGFNTFTILGLEFTDEKNLFPEPHKDGLRLYERFTYVDDRTRKIAKAILMTPTMVVDPFNIPPIPVPERLKVSYRELVAALNPENKDKLFSELRLFL